jgi:hypothetical protein
LHWGYRNHSKEIMLLDTETVVIVLISEALPHPLKGQENGLEITE